MPRPKTPYGTESPRPGPAGPELLLGPAQHLPAHRALPGQALGPAADPPGGRPQPLGQRQFPYGQGAGRGQGDEEQGDPQRHGQVHEEREHRSGGHRGEGAQQDAFAAEDEQDRGGPDVEGLSGGEGVGERRSAGDRQRGGGPQQGSGGGPEEQGPPAAARSPRPSQE